MSRRLLVGLFLVCAAGCSVGRSEPDPKNQLPFGWVDAPAGGSEVQRQVSAHGWALDDGGVAEVRIFLDDHFVARAAVTEQRPDVSKIYPNYAHGNDAHGWSANVPLGVGATLGPHTLLFQAVDNQGASHDIGAVAVRLEH
jgi:hypothetical protein